MLGDGLSFPVKSSGLGDGECGNGEGHEEGQDWAGLQAYLAEEERLRVGGDGGVGGSGSRIESESCNASGRKRGGSGGTTEDSAV